MPRTNLRAHAPATIALAAVLALAVGPSRASATVMVELPLEQLIASADAIVHATVVRTGVRVELRAGAAEPQTITTLRVHEWIAGAGGATVTVRELGGEWAGGGVHYEGTPRYAVGEEVVLFLERRAEAPHDLRTLALVQGKFTVRHGAPGVPSVVLRDLEGIAFARWPHGAPLWVERPAGEPAVELGAFLDTVRAVRGVPDISTAPGEPGRSHR